MATNEAHVHGRGAQTNPQNRFLRFSEAVLHPEAIDDWEQVPRKTEYIFDQSKTIVNEVTSPDVGMLWSANPYQGCEHGCVYCYARNTHEYWGYSAGLDFESRIVVKKNAPALLRKFFNNKNWKPAVISLSGNTDCYQPVERQMRITRQLLEVCLEYRNPVGILTKNALVLRDMDLIQELNKHRLVRVFSSVTSLDEKLRLQLEPRTATYKARLKVLSTLSAAGVPVGVMNAPIIPGLNDHQMAGVLEAARDAGAQWAVYTIVRLNGPIGGIFKTWLESAYPDKAEKVWSMIAQCHSGSVNDNRWGTRVTGDGPVAEIIRQQFGIHTRKLGLNTSSMEWNYADFRRPVPGQTSLF